MPPGIYRIRNWVVCIRRNRFGLREALSVWPAVQSLFLYHHHRHGLGVWRKSCRERIAPQLRATTPPPPLDGYWICSLLGFTFSSASDRRRSRDSSAQGWGFLEDLWDNVSRRDGVGEDNWIYGLRSWAVGGGAAAFGLFIFFPLLFYGTNWTRGFTPTTVSDYENHDYQGVGRSTSTAARAASRPLRSFFSEAY